MSDFNIVIEENPTDVHIDIDPDIDQTNINIDTQQAPVQSVNGKIGFVHIDKNDVGLSNVENISITGVSGYLQYQINNGVNDSDLNTKIDNLSGSSVLTYGDQIINNNKNFTSRPTVNSTGVLLSGEIKTINITYNELTGLKNLNGLIPGNTYKITDFRLMWWNQSTLTVKSGEVEPIIVTAISPNSIKTEAVSDVYKNDIIYYDIDAISSNTWGARNKNTKITGFKGWIYRRVDTQNNIDIGWDWRNITHPCKKINISSVTLWKNITGNSYFPQEEIVNYSGKLYFSTQSLYQSDGSIRIIPNDDISGILFWDTLTAFDEEYTYFPIFPSVSSSDIDYSYNVESFKFNKKYGEWWFSPNFIGEEIQQPTFTNNITGSGSQYLTGIKNITITNGFHTIFYHKMSEYGVQNDINFPKINDVRINLSYMNLFKNNLYSNSIGSSSYNTIGYGFSRNEIQRLDQNNIGNGFESNRSSFFFGNTIGNDFRQNNGNFYYNTFGRSTSSNKIGFASSNIVLQGIFSNDIENMNLNYLFGKGFFYNIIKSLQNNDIGDGFEYNNIGYNFNSNLIESGFKFNSIKNNFEFNDITENFAFNTIDNNFTYNVCGQNFQNNTIENNISGIDFGDATYVYQPYSKTIFKDINGNSSLRYFNENKQIVVVDSNV